MDQSTPGFIVRHKKYDRLPEGAVLISESDALQQQWNNVYSSKSKTDLWPIKYGFIICGAAAALTGVFLTNFYRRKLKLVDVGLVSSYLPNAILPGALNSVFHYKLVTNDILLTKTMCPLCVEVRSSAMQAVFGLLYPLALAPIVSFSFADLYSTYPLPSAWNSPKEVFGIWKKMTRPAIPVLKTLFCLQILLAIGVTYLEGTSYRRMCTEMVDTGTWEEFRNETAVVGSFE